MGFLVNNIRLYCPLRRGGGEPGCPVEISNGSQPSLGALSWLLDSAALKRLHFSALFWARAIKYVPALRPVGLNVGLAKEH